ncbi:MAG: hypothetical protein ABIF84_01370 [Patescibacteria group bacterium]
MGEEERITGYVTLRCGCVFRCLKGKGQNDILPSGNSNSVGDYCRGCHSLVMNKVILFNPRPEEIVSLCSERKGK